MQLYLWKKKRKTKQKICVEKTELINLTLTSVKRKIISNTREKRRVSEWSEIVTIT